MNKCYWIRNQTENIFQKINNKINRKSIVIEKNCKGKNKDRRMKFKREKKMIGG